MDAFLKGQIGFLDIAGTVARVLDQMGTPRSDSLDDVIALDAAARHAALALTQPRAA